MAAISGQVKCKEVEQLMDVSKKGIAIAYNVFREVALTSQALAIVALPTTMYFLNGENNNLKCMQENYASICKSGDTHFNKFSSASPACFQYYAIGKLPQLPQIVTDKWSDEPVLRAAEWYVGRAIEGVGIAGEYSMTLGYKMYCTHTRTDPVCEYVGLHQLPVIDWLFYRFHELLYQYFDDQISQHLK